MRVAFWNRLKDASPDAQAAWLNDGCQLGCRAWDVLILTEVTRSAVEVFRRDIDAASSVAWTDDLPGTGSRPHGVMVLSRSGELGKPTYPSDQLPYDPARLDPELVAHVEERHPGSASPRRLPPERWMTVDLHRDEATTTICGFHAPYADGNRLDDSTQNRLTKRAAYAQLTAWIRSRIAVEARIVVGLDGNTWGDWVTAADIRDDPPVKRRDPMRKLLEDADLFDAEHAFHAPSPTHGLVDSLRSAVVAGRAIDAHGNRSLADRLDQPLAVTHRLTKTGYRMDRLYGSPDLAVNAAGVCHGVHDSAAVAAHVGRADICTGSDHALVWADIT